MRRSLPLAAATAAFLMLVAAGCGGGSHHQTIVFAGTQPGSAVSQLYAIDPSGSGLKQLTKGAQPAFDPAFSHDGKRLAFARTGTGIFTANADGTSVHHLTTGSRDSYPTWSPDGKQIAFVRPQGVRWRLYVVPSSGGTPKELSLSPPAGRPSWTSDGLLLPSGGDLLKIDSASGHVLKYYGANIDAIWGLNSVTLSPDDSLLTYVGAREPEPGDMECGEGPCQRYGLYLESLSGKNAKKPRMIVKDTGPAAFSPDGKQLVFVVRGELELLPTEGGKPKAISTGKVYPAISGPAAWS